MRRVLTFLREEMIGPKGLLIFLILSVALYFPFLSYGFNLDDYFIVLVAEEKIPVNPWLGLWSVSGEGVDGFNSLWWWEHDQPVARFFRPLPSLAVLGLFKLFGRDSACVLHGLSILLHGAAAYTAFRFLLALSGRYAVSLLAGFLFLICEDHSMTVGWIVTITDIMGLVLVNLALYFHVTGRSGGDGRRIILAVVFMVLALLCKETAIMAPAGIVLYEWWLAPREKRFWWAWLPSVILGGAFLIFYRAMGFGTHNLLYTNPFNEPWTYLAGLAANLPIILAGALSVLPVGVALFVPKLILPLVIAGLVLFACFIAALWPYRRDRVIGYCLVLFFVALLPQMALPACERQLYFPFVFAGYPAAFLIFQIRYLRRFVSDVPAGLRRLGPIMGGYLFLSCGVLGLFLTAYLPYKIWRSLGLPQRVVREALTAAGDRIPEHLVMLNTSGPLVTLYVAPILHYQAGRAHDARVLSSFNGRVWIKPLSDRSLLMKTDRPGWLTNMFARVLRNHRTLVPGRRYDASLFTAELVRLTDDRTDALEVRFDFRDPLTTEKTVFLYYDGNRLRRWTFTDALLGRWVLLGDSSDPFKDM